MGDEIIEQRKKLVAAKLSSFLSSNKASWLYWLGLIPIFIVAWFIRIGNNVYLQGKYLVELDSYFFFRYARTIIEQGALPVIDHMRYVPVGYATSKFAFFPHVMAWFYKIILIFKPGLPQITWHVFYPPFITIISFVFFFLFVRELFDNKSALAATAFLSVIPAYIQRTSAGFADHEAMAMLFLFAGFWAFAVSWKSKTTILSIASGITAGALAGAAVASWGGGRYLPVSMGAFMVMFVLFGKVEKQHVIAGISSLASILIFSPYLQGSGFNPSIIFGAENAVMIFGTSVIIATYLLLDKLPKTKLNKYAPAQFLIPAGIALVGIIIGAATNLLNVFSALRELQSIGATRFGTTVSESQHPYFLSGPGWWPNFGIIFFIGLAGMVLMMYLLFRSETEEKGSKYIPAYMSLASLIFIAAFIFGRLSTDPKHAAIVSFFSKTYLYWFLGFFAVLILTYLSTYKKYPALFEGMQKKENWPYLLVFVLFILSMLMARTQIRLLFAFSPALAITAGLLVGGDKLLALSVDKKYILIIQSISLFVGVDLLLQFFGTGSQISTLTALAVTAITGFYIYNAKDLSINHLKYAALIGLFVMSLGAYSGSALVAQQHNLGVGPMVPGQWEDAMIFLRDTTPETSVVAHWWDYGHMISAIGERSSVTDGGNLMGWNHALGRHALTGKEKEQDLTYLKTHEVTHLLISEEEIPKYHAFSLIGSDENLDRRSTIGVFTKDREEESRNGTLILFNGGWGLDKNYIIGDLVLPESQAFIFGFSIIMNGDELLEPKAYVFHNNQQFQFNLNCVRVNQINPQTQQMEYNQAVYFENHTENVLKGCLVLSPAIDNSNQIHQASAALWLSEKVWDTNFARLYVYNELDSNFKQVYSDQTPLGLYQGRIIGPIKIWELNYPDSITADPIYLESSPYG